MQVQGIILEGDFSQPNGLCFLDDRVLDLAEFLLLGQRRAVPLLLRIEIFHLTLQLPPFFIAFCHGRELFHLVHNLIYQRLLLLRKIAIGLLPPDRFQLEGQFLHELLRLRVVADSAFHLLDQLPHNLPRFPHQLVTGNRFLLIEVEHFLLEDIVGELGFDLADAVLR